MNLRAAVLATIMMIVIFLVVGALYIAVTLIPSSALLVIIGLVTMLGFWIVLYFYWK